MDNDELEIIDFEEEEKKESLEPQKEQNSNKDSGSNDPKINPKKKEELKTSAKKSNKTRGIIIAILVFITLAAIIYFLPTIMKHIMKNDDTVITNKTNNKPTKYSSGIDLKEVLNSIKEDKNYIYEENIEINTVDRNDIPQKIDTNLTYKFNPTKFEIDISKTIGNYNEVSYEYYEKIDDVYNKYLYDITTKKFNHIITNETEYNSINNIYNNLINNLLENSNITKEELVKLDNEEKILIETKNNKNIYNLLSFKTDRINSEIDANKIQDEEVIVKYIFSKNKELLSIELELETLEAYKEDNIEEITSIILNFSFKGFNTVKEILIPTE